MAAISETEAINILRGAVMVPSIGLYDDAYPLLLPCCRDKKLVLGVDMVSETSDLLPGMSLRELARKAVVSAISDVSVKGGLPLLFTAAVGMPKRKASKRIFNELREGFADASLEFGVELVTGDIGLSKELIIDVAAAGFAERFVGRCCVRPGDILYVAGGGLGYTWLGYQILLGGKIGNSVPKRLADKAIEYLFRPSPPVKFNYGASRLVNAAMDCSDGLAATLYELALHSGVDLVIDNIPIDKELEVFFSSSGIDLSEPVFYGGEEYVAVGSISEGKVDELVKLADKTKTKVFFVGRAVKKARKAPSVYITVGGERVVLEKRGWAHFG